MSRRTNTRDGMLLSAAQLFRENGIESTALTDVVRHAGAPRGSIYHHFPGGKPQLAEEATRRAGALIGSMISAGLAHHGPVRTLETMIDMFRRQLTDSDYTAGCPIAAAALEGVNYPPAREAAAESFASWEDTIAASFWQHGVSKDRARSLATFAVGAIEGALLLAKAQRRSTPLDRAETELLALVTTALRT